MSNHADDLDSFVRHAEAFGAEEVFETAACSLSVKDLGRLSLRLQNLEPRWRPPGRRGFAQVLLAAGVKPKDVMRQAGVGRGTLDSLQREAEEALRPTL